MDGEKGRGWNLGLAGLLTPVTLWLGLFFLAPLLLVVVYSFGISGVYGGITIGFNPANYLKVLDPLYLEIIGRSFVIAALTTLLCLALGYPLAYFITFRGGRWKTTLILLVMIPFWTSLLVRAYSWVVILSGNGIANKTLQFLGITDEPVALIFTPAGGVDGHGLLVPAVSWSCRSTPRWRSSTRASRRRRRTLAPPAGTPSGG